MPCHGLASYPGEGGGGGETPDDIAGSGEPSGLFNLLDLMATFLFQLLVTFSFF